MNEKGVNQLVIAVFMFVLSVIIVFSIAFLALPYFEKLNDVRDFEHAKDLVTEINSVITDVADLSVGSSKSVSFELRNGFIDINSDTDSITLKQHVSSEIIDENYSAVVGRIFYSRSGNQLSIGLNFTGSDINILTDSNLMVFSGQHVLFADYNSFSGGIKTIKIRVQKPSYS
ncbi:MAG: hypothetical protein ABH821_00635 [archaeon]